MTRAVVFAYHNVGVACLEVLLKHGVEVPLVVTHLDNPNELIWFESVARLAAAHGIAVATPDEPNAPEFEARIRALKVDFLFSFYYRHMLKAPLLEAASRGAYNMHGSLLPKFRGRVPVNWAIIEGETQTGMTLHAMTIKPDAGEIVAQEAVPIGADDTAKQVFDKLTPAAARALDGVLPKLIAGTATHHAQDLTQGRYYGGRKPEDGRIDFTQSAKRIHDFVRALTTPYPGAFSDIAGKRIIVLATERRSPVGGYLEAIPPEEAQSSMLFEHQGELFLRCTDGGVLALTQLLCDGVPLRPGEFATKVSELPVKL